MKKEKQLNLGNVPAAAIIRYCGLCWVVSYGKKDVPFQDVSGLINFCNKNRIKVINKKSLVDNFADRLIY